MMTKDPQMIVPAMPGEPYMTEAARRDEAICLCFLRQAYLRSP